MDTNAKPLPAWVGTIEDTRRLRNYSRADLARRMNVSAPLLTRSLSPKSNPTLGTLERIADALGCRLVLRLEAKDGEPLPDAPPPTAPLDLRVQRRKAREEAARVAESERKPEA